MKFSRRSLLKAMPAVPFAAKGAAAAASDEVAQAVGLKGVGLGEIVRIPEPGDFMPDEEGFSARHEKEMSRLRKVFDYITKHGIPPWKKREIRRYARRNRVLDPDIASYRSVSVSAKLRMQWERTEREFIAKEENRLTNKSEHGEWVKKWGVEYW